ncbi:MAG: low molecular weight phosphotyrosine protein phosphatase [Clostridium sp.]|nr:low molecular weight phosphotyrosine protein phosphatase [Clostridium sp.]
MKIEDAVTAGIPAPSARRPLKILFVCLGNICRSPAAEGIMRRIVEERGDSARWVIDSAGTGGYHIGDLPDRRMRIHAHRRGLELTHVCRQVRESDFDDFDLILAMDSMNERDLRQMAPTVEQERKAVAIARFFGDYSHLDHVPDPYYDGDQGFELVLDILEDACRNIYDTLA